MAKSNTTPVLPISFTDKAFRSRVIILEDGRSFAVAKSAICAGDEVLIQYLDQHPEFERLTPQPAGEA